MRVPILSGARLPTLHLTTSHSQHLNNGKPLGTGYCEGRGSFGSIGHHQSQRPVPRGFPPFKRCEWLVFNRFVSKRRPPYCEHWNIIILERARPY